MTENSRGPSRSNVIDDLLFSKKLFSMPFLTPYVKNCETSDALNFKVCHSACPHACYDSCSLKTFVRDGAIQFVEGALESSFTKGGLCVKGYNALQNVYHPDRIKYPMIQDGRGSGHWRRATWDDVMDRIARKILEMGEKDGSLLGLALARDSSQFGVSSFAAQSMMRSLGYTSRFVEHPLQPAAATAQVYDFGDVRCNDPEDLPNARYIILWGANPAVHSLHSLHFISEARRQGAVVVTVDSSYTESAAQSDVYLQVRPGMDGTLALGMARHILDQTMLDHDFLSEHCLGFEQFSSYLRSEISVEWAARECGIPAQDIRAVAEQFASTRPATIWIGYDMQRRLNNVSGIRALDALIAMTGNVGCLGGGARFGQYLTKSISAGALEIDPPQGSLGRPLEHDESGPVFFADRDAAFGFTDRQLDIAKIARSILETQNPPVRMLWVAHCDPFLYDIAWERTRKAFESLELVVAVEQFFNQTVHHADIVLPATTRFEEWSLNVSCWHYWVNISERAVPPLHEAKCDLEIASLLSRHMNKLSPGSCTFPWSEDLESLIETQMEKSIKCMGGSINEDFLCTGLAKAMPKGGAPWADLRFTTPSGLYEFYSERCAASGNQALPVYMPPSLS